MDKLIRIIAVLITIGLLQTCYGSDDLQVGAKCDNKGDPGTCTLYPKCPSAVKAVQTNHYHDYLRCGFHIDTEIVCCPLAEVSTEKTPNVSDKPSIRSTDMKRKSQEQCEKYYKNLKIKLSPNIIQGTNTKLGDFPHMVALGFYKAEDGEYRFDCGGSLISHEYVLTAAHCAVEGNLTNLKIVRTGVVDVPQAVKEPNWKIDYNISNVTVHDQYKRINKHNDIALIKLEKRIDFTDNLRPACLYTQDDDPEVMTVTGWGAIDIEGKRIDTLQKATLNPVNLEECNITYTRYLQSSRKYIASTQLCAFDEESDACYGDSGGPLQILTNTTIHTVVGITSYGVACGSRYGGVYTRVSRYLDWIENIVWP